MLFAYGDESCDGSKQRVFAVGAVIGAEEQWQALEQNWLARIGGVPFHARDCDSDLGNFAALPQGDNKKLYADLTGLLADSGLGGWSVAIDLASQRDIFPDAMDMSYYKGFSEIVEHMKNCAHFNGERVRFTFDRRQETAYNTALLFTMLRGIPEWERFIEGDLMFECSRNNPRLQAADLFVREVM